MRLSHAMLQLTKVMTAVSFCVGASAAVAATAVRPSVKAIAAPALNSGLPVLPSRAGATTEDSENKLIGAALIPLLTLAVIAVTLTAVVIADDEDDPISPS